VILVGLTVAVSPALGLVVSATVPVKPLTGATVIVIVPEEPELIVTLDGLALIVKSVTVNVALTPWVIVPLVPVITTE
jgi:hypothetical protein